MRMHIVKRFANCDETFGCETVFKNKHSHAFDYRITTQMWQGIAVIILIPILVWDDSANVRTVLYIVK